MKTDILFCSVFFLLISCSKNQRQVSRIDGKWNVVSAEMSGFGEVDPDLIYEFEYCKLKKSDFCEFSILNFDTDEIVSGVYTIIDHGTKVGLTISSGFGFSYREYDIVKLSRRKLVLENSAVPSGELSRIEMRSVE